MGMPPNSMVYRATIWATTKPYSVQLLVEVESKLLYHHTISFYTDLIELISSSSLCLNSFNLQLNEMLLYS